MLGNQLKILFDNQIQVIPELHKTKRKFAVRVIDEYSIIFTETITTGEYKHTTNTINKALEETVDYIAKKLTKLPDNK